MIQELDACPRCGSQDLDLRDLDSGRSSLSQVLKCNVCGTEILIPWREKILEAPHGVGVQEEHVKKDWRVLVE